MLLLTLAALQAATAPIPAPVQARIDRVLRATPLIDGHNDWAEALADKAGRGLWQVDGRRGLAAQGYHTDIARLREGRVGGQF